MSAPKSVCGGAGYLSTSRYDAEAGGMVLEGEPCPGCEDCAPSPSPSSAAPPSALFASLAREEELRRELSEAREALEKVRDMHSPPGHSRCACASCAIVAAALSSAPAAPAPDITSAGVRRGVDAAARILAGNGIDTRGMLHLSPEATEEVGAILGRVQAGLCPGCGHARHAHGECGAGCECIVGPTEPAPAAPPESARELAARRGAPLPSAEEQEDNLVANAGIDPAVPGDACCPVCGCKETRPGTDEWTCECPELDKEEP